MGTRLLLLLAATLLALGGCSTPNGEPGDTRIHPKIWADPASRQSPDFHGTVVNDKGNASCRTCHGSDLLGGSTAPDCTGCHSSIDGSHEPEWSNPDQHGAAAVADLALCTLCHGGDYKGGIVGTSCATDCHTTLGWPHGSEWLDTSAAGFHGTSTVNCTRCHGADLRGGATDVGCFTCHFDETGSRIPPGSQWDHGTDHEDMAEHGDVCTACHGITRRATSQPAECHDCHEGGGHPDDWWNPERHGSAARNDFSICAGCHGSDYRGGTAGVGCYDCHEGPGVNHPTDGWLDRGATRFHGTDPADCTGCHGDDFSGGAAGVPCGTCHFGPGGSRVPLGSGWNHGTVPHGTLESDGGICNACHGITRQTASQPAECHDCHGPADGHTTGRAWLDRENPVFHGDAFLRDTLKCTLCHGVDYGGGITGIGCTQCHFDENGSKVPPGSGWVHGAIPHDTLAGDEDVCNRCHDLVRGFGRGPGAGCHDCHGAGTGHPTGPQWLDRNGSDFHGDAYRQGALDCTVCHGDDFGGGAVGVGCDRCHFGPTGSKAPAGSGWTHGRNPHGTLGANEPACNACHDLVRTYDHGPVPCHNCHDDEPAPHATDRSYLSPEAHGPEAKADLYPCGSCHGRDDGTGNVPFDVGIPSMGGAGCESSGCHFTGTAHPYPFWYNRSDRRHDEAGKVDSACGLCHGTDLSGGSGRACTDCHQRLSPTGTFGTCVSCHEEPPMADETAPNRPGTHPEHQAAGITDCSICHGAGGPGSTTHFHESPQAASLDEAGTQGMTFDLTPGQITCKNTCHAAGQDEDHGTGGKSW